MNILVTGVGGGAGQSILKCLQGTDYRVVAADGEALATGLYAAKTGFVIPYATSDKFIDSLIRICRAENVRLLFPGLDAELFPLSKNREVLADAGICAVVSAPEVIEICDDKLKTSEFLLNNGFPAPKTWLLSEFPVERLDAPIIIKPRIGGARSKGVRLVANDTDLARATADLNGLDYVAQEMIDGPEYTCGTLNIDGVCRGAVVSRRVLRDGDTYKAFVERDQALEAFVQSVANHLRPFGACNFQLRFRDGVPYIFEINARCSGTTYCRALAGFNEPKMMADFVLLNIEPEFTIKPITVFRYWKEMAIEKSALESCKESGSVQGLGVNL